MGILIAIEGTDASGKQTQSELLYNAISARGARARVVSFPAYENDSSALVKMYLNGDFGTDPDDVNAYAASTFYAADRFATFRTDWGRDYDNNTVIIADRYVPSNIIHQASKLKTDKEKLDFISWLEELEYGIYGLPKPDITIFLDMPAECAGKLMADRANKIDNSSKKDIHERNAEYLKKSHDHAVHIADTCGWTHIMCTNENGIRTAEDIHKEIINIISTKIGL